MNHANLEISKIIGKEFPDSEFVHVLVDTNEFGVDRFAYDGVHKRSRTKRPWEVYYSAATCEELGAWLKKWFRSQADLRQQSESSRVSYLLLDCLLSDDEPQKRAEVVKLFLGEK